MWEWRQELGRPECPFIRRWMLQTRLGSVRLHHWLASDDDRAMHNHPWWFATLVLKGGYTDISTRGRDHLHIGSTRFRRPEHAHIADPDPGGAWTLVITGPAKRGWGFWVKGKDGIERFLNAVAYTAIHGERPCD